MLMFVSPQKLTGFRQMWYPWNLFMEALTNQLWLKVWWFWTRHAARNLPTAASKKVWIFGRWWYIATYRYPQLNDPVQRWELLDLELVSLNCSSFGITAKPRSNQWFYIELESGLVRKMYKSNTVMKWSFREHPQFLGSVSFNANIKLKRPKGCLHLFQLCILWTWSWRGWFCTPEWPCKYAYIFICIEQSTFIDTWRYITSTKNWFT